MRSVRASARQWPELCLAAVSLGGLIAAIDTMGAMLYYVPWGAGRCSVERWRRTCCPCMEWG
jgi:hypothetical protein